MRAIRIGVVVMGFLQMLVSSVWAIGSLAGMTAPTWGLTDKAMLGFLVGVALLNAGRERAQ